MSPLFPLPVGDFGPLNFAGAVDEVAFNGAIDLQDVTFDQQGRLRSRNGYASFATNASSPFYTVFPHVTAAGALQLLTLQGSLPTAFNSSGALIVQGATTAVITGGTAAYARLDTPSTTKTWIAAGSNGLISWDGSAFAQTTAAAIAGSNGNEPQVVGSTPVDNRLVLGNLKQGATTYGSRVRWSDPGAPTTYGTNNYDDLSPGDGESVRAIVTWGTLTFVFKTTRHFVFYGDSTDATGNPVFNYRPMRGGCAGPVPGMACATPIGVVFADNLGVYLTTGGTPQKISDAIEPWLRGQTLPFFNGPTYTPANNSSFGSIGYAGRNVYVAFAGPGGVGATNATFVWNIDRHDWTYYSWNNGTGGVPLAVCDDGQGGTDVYLAGLGDAAIYRHRYGLTTDAGTAITSRYQSGFDNLAPPRRFAAHYLFGNTRKRIRKWKLTGTGTVAFNVAHDFGAMVAANSRNVTLGTSPAIKDGWYQVAKRGQKFSYRIASVSGPWSVESLTSYLAGSEPPLLGSPSDT